MWELLPHHYPDCLQHLQPFGLFLYGRKIHWPCKKDARLDVHINRALGQRNLSLH